MTKILLVDDDPSIVGLLQHIFVDSGYQTWSALDGMTALQEFPTARPDVAIIDLRMPNMDGFELCRRIREISPIPIIVLTGLEQIGDKVNAFNAGADDYVAKPVRGRELLARVAACLRRSLWSPPTESTSLFNRKHMDVDFTREEVFIDGKIEELTSIEYSLIGLYVQKYQEVMSLKDLLTNMLRREDDAFDQMEPHVVSLIDKLDRWSDYDGFALA